ncbi:CPBP family intramembrane metalloprotease [Anaerolineae bacterium CFX7]|nr:CPBP family intramembrane metalloprotease [Anaerolineae bacterium CFX7]
MSTYFQNLVQDARCDARAFAQNRAALCVALLFLLPWFVAIVTGRNTNPFPALGEIFGLMLVYWFFTRRRAVEETRVRQPIVESALALAFVLAWMLFRVGQYANVYVLPTVSVANVRDVMDTIAPKMLEMVVLPLALWLALGYRPRELGLRSMRFDWVAPLLPIAVLLYFGLHHHTPEEWWARFVYFLFGAGIPEEFLFRGIVQTRLIALVKNPVWGLYLAALAFGFSHLPINLAGVSSDNWLSAFQTAFTFQLGVGLALGYAYYRVRALPPLMLLHTLLNAAP